MLEAHNHELDQIMIPAPRARRDQLRFGKKVSKEAHQYWVSEGAARNLNSRLAPDEIAEIKAETDALVAHLSGLGFVSQPAHRL